MGRIAAAFVLVAAAFAAPPAAAANYSDIWWSPAESGWGLTIADHETDLWVVWYTYRQDGTPTWMFASGGTFTENRRRFAGDLFQATGPAYRAAFSSKPVSVSKVGTISIDFAPPGLAEGNALFTYAVANVSGSKTVQRFGFGNGAPAWGTDNTDLWWNPQESGWGIALAQHGNMLFGVWYTYDEQNQPLFVVLPGGVPSDGGRFQGDIFTTRGSWFGAATYDGSKSQVVPLGTAQVTIAPSGVPRSDGFVQKAGTWAPRLADGTQLSKSFTQLPFGNAAPAPSNPTSSSQCSYRTCRAGSMGDGYYSYSTPCSCSMETDNLDVACLASRPQVGIGQSCALGQGCPVGSVCADLLNGSRVCMAERSFMDAYCTY